MVKQINVVGAVIIRDGLVLCAQRGLQTTLGGMWEFPGGKIEPDETPREALEREIREELALDVEVGDQVAVTTHSYSFGDVTLTTFYCTLLSGEVVLSEHEAIVWLAPHELDTLEWAPADVPAVHSIAQRFASA